MNRTANSSARPLLRSFPTEYLGLTLALSALVGVFSLITDHFFSVTTFRTIANQIPSAVLVATAMTYLLVIAEIDLSVGSVLGFCSAVLGVAMTQWHWPLPLAVIGTIAAGLLCGAFNGLVSVHWRLPSFIVTLGMLEMARGAAHANQQRWQRASGGRCAAPDTALGITAAAVAAGGRAPCGVNAGAVVACCLLACWRAS